MSGEKLVGVSYVPDKTLVVSTCLFVNKIHYIGLYRYRYCENISIFFFIIIIIFMLFSYIGVYHICSNKAVRFQVPVQESTYHLLTHKL